VSQISGEGAKFSDGATSKVECAQQLELVVSTEAISATHGPGQKTLRGKDAPYPEVCGRRSKINAKIRAAHGITTIDRVFTQPGPKADPSLRAAVR
jgi:hypothetical protein